MRKHVLLSTIFIVAMSLFYTSCTKEVLSGENSILSLKIVNLNQPVDAVIDQTAIHSLSLLKRQTIYVTSRI